MLANLNSAYPVEAKVAIIMGSKNDWSTMQYSASLLTELKIPFYIEIISAHRTPDRLFSFAEKAKEVGLHVIIAGAGGAAHLPGMLAAKTLVPILGVPLPSTILNGIDSLYSIVQMPRGIPVGTLAIGKTGAANAALLAAQILALHDKSITEHLISWRNKQTKAVLNNANLRENI
ncbi:5-(carboxyamino)imidazole ribonucleotide mutase [Candidatus Fukatsuia anoeciicola]|uniref:5-(carboxyamino)imidazole ribonucleotide mutase n=1 Tax=Candidatus Fukatsuia anoeciicola TaxID=2994492 RepID=UPI0034639FF8